MSDVSGDQGFCSTLVNQGPFFFSIGGGLIPAGGKKQPPIQWTRRHIGYRVDADPDLDVTDLAQGALSTV